MKSHQTLKKFLVFAVIRSSVVIINHKSLFNPTTMAKYLHKGTFT